MRLVGKHQLNLYEIREQTSENACGYTLKTGHFSKFAVGGSISPPLQESQ